MLDKTLKEHADKLVPPELDKLREEALGEVARKSAELSTHGLAHSGAAIASIHTICVKQVEKRAEAVWRVLQRVMEAIRTVRSDTLAADLKEFVNYYVPISLWELPGLYAKVGGQELYDKRFGTQLLETREQVLRRLDAEIDLHVDGLRARAPQARAVVAKERDQKFGILLSPKQAQLDFDTWKARFAGGNASIAVLYLDIDNFKNFNTRYAETVVDKTILPDLLRLLASLVDQRGEGYQEGGDEFVLILPNLDETEANTFAEKIRAHIASHQFQVRGQTETLTISGGLALWPEHGATYDVVLEKANQAKQIAKQTRNTILLVGAIKSSSGSSTEPSAKIASSKPRTVENGVTVDNAGNFEIYDAPTVFFANRISGTFPGVRGLSWFNNSKEALDRIALLLKEPIAFKRAGGHGTDRTPIWWWRGGSSCPISIFRRLSDTRCLLGIWEIEINRIAVFRGNSYAYSFVYVEVSPDQPVGIYKRDQKDIEEAVRVLGYAEEEYGLYKDTPVTRACYDDGAAVINGEVVDISGAELRARFLSKYNFLIAAKYSPINSQEFDQISKPLLNEMLLDKDHIADLCMIVDRLPRLREDG